MISIIVAADNNLAIGAKNRIPWRLRDDLVMLKRLTEGHTVILGRKSYDSMVGYYDKSSRPMPGKTYIIVTRNVEYKPTRDNARVVHSIDDAIALGKELGDEQVFSIGGGDIFSATLPYADRVYFTKVDTVIDEPDAFFPPLDMNKWREVSREHHKKDDRNEFDHDFVVYERR
jgi:dihydrofolate reductase